jgi:trans-aconitate 2-methyltransferase
MKWDPQLYGTFSDHRRRPFDDLVVRISGAQPDWVADLGCGTGELTAELALRWPGARVTGVDSSAEMISAARSLSGPPNLSFLHADIRRWTPPKRGTGVIVTNAALQWVPEHRELLRGWAHALAPGSWLAMQVPGNFSSPSHALLRELAGSAKWRGRLGGVLRHSDAVAEPAEYLELLAGAGMLPDVWETTYRHVLQGKDPVLEWMRGSGLRPVLAALAAQDADVFEREYGALLRKSYPATRIGTILPFRRIFAVGVRQ